MLHLTGCEKSGFENETDPYIPPADEEKVIIIGELVDIDSNVYKTVAIGKQVWMAENLRTTRYSDSTAIGFPDGDNDLWKTDTGGAYAWYNNEEPNKDLYGAVYNWYAAANARNVCPAGWRVPNNTDWELMESSLRKEYSLSNNRDSINGLGNKLKSCRQVGSPLGDDCDTTADPSWRPHNLHYGTDDFGFSALPEGSRSSSGVYISNPGTYGHWWSSTGSDQEKAFVRYITYDHGALFNTTASKAKGYSVRCIKN
jgi:uncharacterized protein (TIGR02145 family)